NRCMAFFLHPHALPLLPSYPYVRTSATGLHMKRIRIQDDEPSFGDVATGVALGALAGLVGGISGLAARIRERLGTLAHPEDEEEARAHTHHDGYDEEEDAELDEDEE